MTTLAATAAALLTAALMLLTQSPGTHERRRTQCPARHTQPTPSRCRCRAPGHPRPSATCRGKAHHPENLLTSPPRFLIGAKTKRTGRGSRLAKPSRSDARRAALTRSSFAGQSAARNGESHATAGRRTRVLSAAANVFATADLVLLTQWACAPATPRSAPHMTAATHPSGLPARSRPAARTGGRP